MKRWLSGILLTGLLPIFLAGCGKLNVNRTDPIWKSGERMVLFSENHHQAFFFDRTKQLKGDLRSFNPQTGEYKTLHTEEGRAIYSVQSCSDGSICFTSVGADGVVMKRRAPDGTVATLPLSEARVSPDGGNFVSLDSSKTPALLILHDREGRVVRNLGWPPAYPPVRTIAEVKWSRDGRKLLAPSYTDPVATADPGNPVPVPGPDPHAKILECDLVSGLWSESSLNYGEFAKLQNPATASVNDQGETASFQGDGVVVTSPATGPGASTPTEVSPLQEAHRKLLAAQIGYQQAIESGSQALVKESLARYQQAKLEYETLLAGSR